MRDEVIDLASAEGTLIPRPTPQHNEDYGRFGSKLLQLHLFGVECVQGEVGSGFTYGGGICGRGPKGD